ncbi:MAG: SulP family inorganic anion transporter [Betaproteobacteria bacterium]|nr:SulP family inorganic anion transporter [Betaproteobacteria bacterium]
MIPFKPRIFECFSGYSLASFGCDVGAGITVGILALPLAMAFAIASGCSPAAGIWTAIVAGFFISALGGSRVQIGGPTGAFIPIIYAIVLQYGMDNLLIATFIAGLILLTMGVAHLGQLIRFIPKALVVGFTNGIAVVIFMAQIRDFLGLSISGGMPAEFFGKLRVLGASIHTTHWPTLLLSLVSLAFLIFYNQLAERLSPLRRLPGPLIVLVFGTLLAYFLDLPVETIGSRFNGIPQQFPAFGVPALSLETLGKLISPALTIALLGAIESLLSARVADGLVNDRHNPNQELIAQGLANIAAPFFGGFAATGAIARTATNAKSGGRTPVAGIVHSMSLLVIVLVAAPLASYIPLAVLSAIVVLVSVHMGNWREFRELKRYTYNYRILLLATFFITVVFDLTLAVELGMVLATLLFIYRVSALTKIEACPLHDLLNDKNLEPSSFFTHEGAPRATVWKLSGVLFFGSVNKLEILHAPREMRPQVMVLDLQDLLQLDTTGLEGLETVHQQMQRENRRMILCSPGQQPGSLILRSGFLDRLGAHNVCKDLQGALLEAQKTLEETPT